MSAAISTMVSSKGMLLLRKIVLSVRGHAAMHTQADGSPMEIRALQIQEFLGQVCEQGFEQRPR